MFIIGCESCGHWARRVRRGWIQAVLNFCIGAGMFFLSSFLSGGIVGMFFFVRFPSSSKWRKGDVFGVSNVSSECFRIGIW